MKLKLNRPIIFFDLETTGTDKDKDRIVELAAIRIEPDSNGEAGKRITLEKRFNPGVPIPKEATAVHGISYDDVKNCPYFERCAKEIYNFFNGADLGGFNIVRFDVPLLQSELARCNLSLDLTVDFVDACEIYHKREPRDLSAALKFYAGEEHADAHNALSDVEATLKVLLGQMEKYSDMPNTPSGIYNETRDPDAVDFAGKMKWRGDDIVLTFGKEKDKPLREVPQSYLYWCKQNNVLGPDVMPIINAAFDGKFITREEWENARKRW